MVDCATKAELINQIACRGGPFELAAKVITHVDGTICVSHALCNFVGNMDVSGKEVNAVVFEGASGWSVNMGKGLKNGIGSFITIDIQFFRLGKWEAGNLGWLFRERFQDVGRCWNGGEGHGSGAGHMREEESAMHKRSSLLY